MTWSESTLYKVVFVYSIKYAMKKEIFEIHFISLLRFISAFTRTLLPKKCTVSPLNL